MDTGEIAPAVAWQWHGVDDVNELDECHMAVDGKIFEAVGQGNLPPTIRCYTWQRPAISIGRLQDDASARSDFPELPVHRRPTGGKAVEHGDDLTICVSAPNNVLNRYCRSNKLWEVYETLVWPVRSTLAHFNVPTVYGDYGASRASGYQGSDCFKTTARCDVVNQRGIKVLGSAMRRSSSAVIVQMSLRPLDGVDVVGPDFGRELHKSYMRFTQIGR